MKDLDKLYTEESSENFADMLNYVVNICNINGDDFLKKFVESEVGREFEIKNPKYAVGLSGIELALKLLEETEAKNCNLDNTSIEYWAAYVLAKYKFYSKLPFTEILKKLSFEKITKLYYPLHEADITKFYDIAERYCNE
jgi:hypothetical protein